MKVMLACWHGGRGVALPWFCQEISRHIGENAEILKLVTERQKSYADMRRKDMRYEIDEKVFLKVSPWKKVMRFGKNGKLSPKFIGPYEVI